MFGCPRVIKNLSLVGKQKRANKLDYQTYKPEMILLDEVLNKQGIDHEKLVWLSILVGTDFNPGGVKGIGPKNALKIVKECESKEALLEKVKDKMEFDFDEVQETVKTIPVTDDYLLEWKPVDKDKVKKILVTDHNFSEERIKNTLKALEDYSETKKQTSLGAFI